jgi:hypothetical protein
MQPPDRGTVVEFPEVGGLHHHYERLAAEPECSKLRSIACYGFSGRTPLDG